MAIRLQPHIKLVEWLGPQLIYALLGNRMYLHKPGLAEHAEMFRYLRLTNPEPVGNFPYRTGPVAQELDNVQSIRFGQSTQRCQHTLNMPQREYSCQGI